MIKKLSFISLFTIGISIIASAQISWAFKVNFNDGGKNYSGLLALNKDGCGAIRLKSSTGAIFDQILHWAPTQWEDSYWLLSDKINIKSPLQLITPDKKHYLEIEDYNCGVTACPGTPIIINSVFDIR